MQHTNASKTSRLPSLVETISSGFAAVNRRLWVLVIPVLLDLLYWAGPRVSFEPLMARMIALLETLNPEAVTTLRDQLGPGPYFADMPLDLSLYDLPKFFYLLTPLITLPQPPIAPQVWSVGSVLALLGFVALINLAWLLLTWLYLLPLAGAVRSQPSVLSVARRWAKSLLSLLSIVLMLAGLILALVVPFFVVASFASLVSPVAATVILIFMSALLFWLLFTTSFSFDAVMISDAGPVRALLSSLFVVQRSFWSAAGLLLIGWLIVYGMSIVWQQLAGTPAGLMVAVVGSAYIGSGLVAAHLIFYRDRLSRSARRSS